jgi:ribosomal 50S subunit-recycling heat shock protein
MYAVQFLRYYCHTGRVYRDKGITMRLDKYLKVSRLIKRRTVANDACDAGRVMVNGKAARASYDVKVGDEISIGFGNKEVKVRVKQILESTKKESAEEMYEYI